MTKQRTLFEAHDELTIYAAQLLANVEYGLTWTQIAKFFKKKSIEHKVRAPYVNAIFPSELPNRQVGFIENLKVFSSTQRIALLLELCDNHKKVDSALLRKMLLRQYRKDNIVINIQLTNMKALPTT